MARSSSRSPRARDERGVVLPSPVVMLSVVAVAMAAIAFVATRDAEPTEREVATVSQPQATPDPTPSEPAQREQPEKKRPAVQRGKVYVEVYNNSGITGLAGRAGGVAADAGWQVVGTDNWYGGNIPANTVYYPERLARAAKLLALDLGIDRVAPAVEPMRFDRLTLILTGEL